MRHPNLAFLARSLKVSIADRAAYRGDFLISLLVTLLFELATPLVTILVYGSGSQFPGWSLDEALVLQAVLLIARGIAFSCFFGMVWVVLDQAREGTFELTLLKPRSPLLVVLALGLDPQALIRLAGGALLLAYALSRLPPVGLANALGFVALLCVSLLVLFSFALVMAGALFVWIGNSRVFEILETALGFSRYPATVYQRSAQFVFAVIMPLSALAFFPAAVLLGKEAAFLAWSLPSSLALAALAYLFWKAMIKRYSSGGG
jgi:ABC-2 type transport system permease protein